MLSKEEIEKLLDCSECNLKECIACEITYTDKQKIKKCIELLESELETNKIGLDEIQKEAIKIAKEKNALERENKKLRKKVERLEKQLKINGTKDDISAMLLSAERYALGRQTYIVNWTCEFIVNNLHLLLPKDIKVMIRDIKQQDEYGYGHRCDEENWMRLLKVLENELKDKEG